MWRAFIVKKVQDSAMGSPPLGVLQRIIKNASRDFMIGNFWQEISFKSCKEPVNSHSDVVAAGSELWTFNIQQQTFLK